MAVPRRRSPWRRRLQRWLVLLLCRLLPLELLVPLIARTPLLDLGLQAAYRAPVLGDGDLHRLFARPARRPTAAWALRGMSIGMALRPRGATAAALLERLSQPLLVIWGEADRLVPPEVAALLHRHKADLQVERLAEVGHCPHDEAPERFCPLLLRWLDRLPTVTA
jgi:pimeloyl-ACP methyl ester carboxylesterase